MKKYLVIGNPIDHSLSPKLHNHWLKENNIDAIYEKKKINENEIKNVILKVRKNQIQGINVTVPFKKDVIPYLDILSEEASSTRSVNTIYLDKNKVVGHNTDAEGFRLSLQNMENDLKGEDTTGGVMRHVIVLDDQTVPRLVGLIIDFATTARVVSVFAVAGSYKLTGGSLRQLHPRSVKRVSDLQPCAIMPVVASRVAFP